MQAKSAKHSILNDADFNTIFTNSLLGVFSLALPLSERRFSFQADFQRVESDYDRIRIRGQAATAQSERVVSGEKALSRFDNKLKCARIVFACERQGLLKMRRSKKLTRTSVHDEAHADNYPALEVEVSAPGDNNRRYRLRFNDGDGLAPVKTA